MTTFEIVIFVKYLTTTAIGIIKHDDEEDNGHIQFEFLTQHQQPMVT
jgi:hypothetical protein